MRLAHISGLVALLGATLVAAPGAAHLPDRDARTTLPVPTTSTVTAAQLGDDSVVAVVTHGDIEKRFAEGIGSVQMRFDRAIASRHPARIAPVNSG